MSLRIKIFKKKTHTVKQPIDRQLIVENLVNAAKIFNDLGMKSWLTDGTLLGYYRENEILAHDEDADMGCYIDEYDHRLPEKFSAEGWTLKYVFGRIDLGLELSFVRKGIKLDIFFFYKDGNRYWHGAWVQEKKKRRLIQYYYDAFELKTAEFYGHTFYIPADTLKYVTTKYGPGWNVPQKNWDWAYGPANAVATEIRIPRNKNNRIR